MTTGGTQGATLSGGCSESKMAAVSGQDGVTGLGEFHPWETCSIFLVKVWIERSALNKEPRVRTWVGARGHVRTCAPTLCPWERHFTRIPPQLEGQVSNGSCLQLADESSARRAGVIKAELERNQVTGSSLQAPEPEPARLPRWIRWGRRMPKCVGLRFATCYPP
ncbi:hypothetical protein Bbelb_243910 [Branchiostoma belcheri]|nr:hypothetical protein Bbelb_243910 [Branchiostoma belcheri]